MSLNNPQTNANHLVKVDKLFATPNFNVKDEYLSYEFIRDICLYLSQKSQADLFGSYSFDYIKFASEMGYSAANLRRFIPVINNVSSDKDIDKHFNTLIGHALFTLGTQTIPLITHNKETEHWKASTSIDFIQIFSNLTIGKDKFNKVLFSFKLTDQFIENMTLHFFKIDLNVYTSLKPKGTENNGKQNLYLYLLNQRNRIAALKSQSGNTSDTARFNNGTSSRGFFNVLKDLVQARFGDESKNKQKIKKTFELLFPHTGATIDFSLSPNKNYYYEPIVTFHNMTSETIDLNNDFKQYSRHRELFLTMLNRKLWEFYSAKIDFDSFSEVKQNNTYDKFIKWKSDKIKHADFKASCFVEMWNKYMVLSKKFEAITEKNYKVLIFVETGEVDFKN